MNKELGMLSRLKQYLESDITSREFHAANDLKKGPNSPHVNNYKYYAGQQSIALRILAMLNESEYIPGPVVYASPISKYHEDMGSVLWWKFPIEEPPYVGSPLDTEWPGYHTHFTHFKTPVEI